VQSDLDPLAMRRRRDIQGLRAVAVLLVALDHAGVSFLQGGYVGVDVFFVLSGYLITGVLVSAAERVSGSGYFLSFYGRRARRILPAATLTLVVTDLAASHLLNLYRAHQVLVDSVYATFFVANRHFASVGTNYFAMGQPPSALQNFWSLSVEEQFYLVWPLLVALALLGLTLRGRRERHLGQPLSRRSLLGLEVVAVTVTVASLAFAAYDTHHSSAFAYFSSVARAWELGLGAILWLNVRRLARLSQTQLAVVGWVGLTAILVASVGYSPSTLFPGLPALLPTLGAAAVIAAGLHVEQARFAPSRLLSLRPFRYVGDRSYAFYLWHWPVLILAMEHAEHSLSLANNLALLVGAFLLSMLTYSAFENPIRRTSKLRGRTALALWPAAILTVFFVSAIHWSDYQDAVNLAYAATKTESLVAPESTESAEASETSVGGPPAAGRPASPPAVIAAADAVKQARRVPSALSPPALTLASSEYKVPADCISSPGQTHSSICSFGHTSSKKTLVVLGDSHALMWLPAIVGFAQREGYDVRPIMKYRCTVPTWAGSERESECATWYRWAVSQAELLHPSLLILAAHYSFAGPTGEMEVRDTIDTANIAAFGAAVRPAAHRIVVLGDSPGQEKEPSECLLSSHATMKTCSYTEESSQAETTASVESATKAFGSFVDSTPWFCYQTVCPMVIGHIVVYFDHSHITTPYTEELTPLFTTALKRLLTGSSSDHK